MLSTPWSRAMGLRVPIVNAPMGGVAGGRLAAAVTAAGGLGMVGMGTAGSTSSLRAELPHVAGAFGIGLVGWGIRKEPCLFDAALAARPVLISVSFGTDLSWVSRVHDAGIATATQVYNSVEARRAEDAGVDLLVARGSEGGGHGEATIGTLPLLDAVLDVVSVPVLAAGGIASERSLAAVLAAGAAGAWLGTCLSASVGALTTDAGRRAWVARGGARGGARRLGAGPLPVGVCGGADARRRPPRVGGGQRDRYHQHQDVRHRPPIAVGGAVPVARATQRLRRA